MVCECDIRVRDLVGWGGQKTVDGEVLWGP